MKYKLVLKSFLLFALIFTFSSGVYASEVTGNLSSTGVNNENSTIDGSISGTVTSPQSNDNGGGGRSSSGNNRNGLVLGASTTEIASSNNNSVSTDGMALNPPSNGTVYGSETTSDVSTDQMAQAYVATPADNPLTPVTFTSTENSGLSTSSWIWIILIILLLIIIINYIYNGSKNRRGIRNS